VLVCQKEQKNETENKKAENKRDENLQERIENKNRTRKRNKMNGTKQNRTRTICNKSHRNTNAFPILTSSPCPGGGWSFGGCSVQQNRQRRSDTEW